MSRSGEECKIDTWEISRLIDASRPEPRGKDKIIIPNYQRGLVWSHDKQKDLIDSIKEGFPLGSLLLYEDSEIDGKRRYSLIDGLQRTHAIRSYMETPNQFFSAEDVSDALVEVIVDELRIDGLEAHKRVSRILAAWVRERKGFSETDGWGVSGLARRLVVELLCNDEDSDEYRTSLGEVISNSVMSNRLENFLEKVRTGANINDAQLSVILYSGDFSKLPRIFELLNSQGVALSRYDVYAARWINFKLRIREDAIRIAIKRKYAALVDEGFTTAAIDYDDEDESEEGRNYTLFEYLFGFGQNLSKEFPCLFGSVKADAPSSIGFNLVTTCIGMRLNEMEKLDARLKDRSLDLNVLGDCILESVRCVDECLRPILSINQRDQPAIFHAELQIISFIASVFMIKYDVKTLDERQGWKKSRKDLLAKLPMYYLYDILRGHWRGSGDSKMFDDVTSQRYSRRPPTIDQWKQALDSWFEDSQITMQHQRRYIRKAAPEILLLKYIYGHKFTVMQSARKYHVEHIIPVKRLARQAKQDGNGWPINCIANLALLEQEQNQRKGDKAFAEYWGIQLDKGSVDQSGFDENLRLDEEKLLCPVKMLPKELDNLNREDYESFLQERFKHLRDEFISIWADHIPEA